jgi:hypothetical protein
MELGQEVYLKTYGNRDTIPAINEGTIIEVGKAYVVIEYNYSSMKLKGKLKINKSSYRRIIPKTAESIKRYEMHILYLQQYHNALIELKQNYFEFQE